MVLFGGVASAFFEPAVELVPIVFKQVERVVLHLLVDPLFVYVLVSHEAHHFGVVRVRARLLEVAWQVGFPVRIDEGVGELLEGLSLARGPLVQINRLDFRDVRPETPVLAYTSHARTNYLNTANKQRFRM